MKNQPQDNTAPFTAPEIAEAFHLATQGWTTSKGKPITTEQRDVLVQKYLKKEREGEYLTRLGENGLTRALGKCGDAPERRNPRAQVVDRRVPGVERRNHYSERRTRGSRLVLIGFVLSPRLE